MAISRQDADEILRSIREHVRNSPLSAVDQQIIGAALDGDPDRQLVRYIDFLMQAIAARGGYDLTRSLRDLNEYVRTEDGQQISGIEVVFDDERARAFDTHRFVLQSDAALRELAGELSGIRDIIERDSPPRRGDDR
jgi:hypothetical protein